MMRDGLSSRDRDLLCNEVLCKAFFQNIFTMEDKNVRVVRNPSVYFVFVKIDSID